MMPKNELWLDEVKWNSDGLVPAIAQDSQSGKILSLAWMNKDSLKLTITEQRAVYWSRSRQKIWRKGEQSGHIQELQSIFLDCDGDSIVMKVKQIGGIACHTGRESCFYKKLSEDGWQDSEPVLKPAKEIYKKNHE